MKKVLLKILCITTLLFSYNSLASDLYTSRNFTYKACVFFANDVVQAIDYFKPYFTTPGAPEQEALLDLEAIVDSAKIPDSMRLRISEAILLVYNHKLIDNEVGRALAMGNCMKPKQNLPPMEQTFTEVRTYKEYF